MVNTCNDTNIVTSNGELLPLSNWRIEMSALPETVTYIKISFKKRKYVTTYIFLVMCSSGTAVWWGVLLLNASVYALRTSYLF
jgi:hypothetical protein